MYQRILAAIDESPTAQRVLATAGELAILTGAEVFVLNVWEGEPSKYKACNVTSYEDADMMVKAVEKLEDAGAGRPGK